LHIRRLTSCPMELFGLQFYYYGVILCLAFVFHATVTKVDASKKFSHRLPPGPWQLPVIGSLHHLLRGLPHHTIRDLSMRHGPLMQLRICEHLVVVVSSAEAAREIFQGRDTAFEQRPSSPGMDDIFSGNSRLGVFFAPYGERWRLLRRVLVNELLSARRVQAFQSIRQEEAARLVTSLASSPPGQIVNLDKLLAEFIAESSVRAIFGDRLPDRAAFLKMMKRGTDISSVFDLHDLFPSSRLVRMLPQSHRKKRHRQEVSRLINDIIHCYQEREQAAEARDGEREQNMIDVLLRIQNETSTRLSLTPGVISALAMEIFFAAVDTSTSTLQWAMAELIANPRVMKKAQLEVRRVLAGQEGVQEEALKEMHYLKAIVRETLRLHTPGPFIPRVCLDDQKIQGYDVPQGTIILLNAWAVSRDPKYWENSERFVPERFEGECTLDFKGLDFEFTPFGAGRRICPGITFAEANIERALASLLYHFDWELPSGVKNEEIDMTESFGFFVKRKTELLLYPITYIPPV
ncbi:hypothetical protein EJB05_27488, partial [Eragrostis curvula]